MTEMILRLRAGSRMSKIVSHAGLVYLAGQTSSGTPIPDIAGQTREVLGRIDELLAEAGSDKSRLLTVTIYLRNIADFAAMNVVWEAWLAGMPTPARATVEALLASPDLLVEMSVIAAA